MQLVVLKNLKELEKFANFFVENLPIISEKALIVGLLGDLGSGKTTFVQAVAKILNIKELLVSPTFVIQKKYPISNEKTCFKNLIHIDAYRLENGKDLLNLNWNEIKNDSRNLVFIEWPERVEDIFETEIKKIYFKFLDENTRELRF